MRRTVQTRRRQPPQHPLATRGNVMPEYSTPHLTEIPHVSRALPRRRRAAARRVKTAVVCLHTWSTPLAPRHRCAAVDSARLSRVLPTVDRLPLWRGGLGVADVLSQLFADAGNTLRATATGFRSGHEPVRLARPQARASASTPQKGCGTATPASKAVTWLQP